MYRTNDTRDVKSGAKDLPELSEEKISLLTQEQAVDVGSRLEILQTLLGYKWVGEAAHVKSKDKSTGATHQQEKALELLKKVGLVAKLDLIKRDKTYFSWVQFAVNEALLNSFMNKTHPFNVLEEGLAYGFPASATLAFAGMIPKKVNRQKMQEVAPILIEEAEEEYRSLKVRILEPSFLGSS